VKWPAPADSAIKRISAIYSVGTPDELQQRGVVSSVIVVRFHEIEIADLDLPQGESGGELLSRTHKSLTGNDIGMIERSALSGASMQRLA
jgi:hypothetical protein